MKDKELAELKAYVFAMYQCCTGVMKWRGYGDTGRTDPYLQLRPLSSITDAEAIELLSAIIGYKGDQCFIRDRRKTNIVVYNCLPTLPNPEIQLFFEKATIYVKNQYGAELLTGYQYLQQQSFALPIFFKGLQYSVEDLVSKGIIVLSV